MAGPLEAQVESVYDGDTFHARVTVWPGVLVETSVRIRGIDTPEIKGKCDAERPAAGRARDRLRALLATGVVTLRDIRPDKYGGRVDADVMVADTSVAAILVPEGLARRYEGGRRGSWCE
jgi:micrococcal nuclease